MQQLQLSIPEPCHENWQQMTPTDQGRFCNACAKEVVDFSTMTDIQVLNYFNNMTNEKVCGRALPEQLDRAISQPEQPKKRLFWYWNYIVMFFMFFTKGNTIKAQGGVKPVTACSPVKGKSEVITVAGYTIGRTAQTITGKVTDKDGIPLSFASIIIKGAGTGVAADANGTFSIKAGPNDVITISSAGFKPLDVKTGTGVTLNIVLEKSGLNLGEMAVNGVSGGMKRRIAPGTGIVKSSHVNPVIVFEVKEDGTGLPIHKAAISISGKGDNPTGKSFSDEKGIYVFKQIKLQDSYFVKVEATGYESNEFAITEIDLNDRKKGWEVLLSKQKSTATPGKETTVRLRCENSIPTREGLLYIVDGTIVPNDEGIDAGDVENYSILQGPAAAALFGPDGANGAVIITTKKLQVKNLDTVTVSTHVQTKGKLKFEKITSTSTSAVPVVMGGMVKGETIRVRNTITDSLNMLATKISGAIKLYPNPVQRGEQFSIVLKLKQTGLYRVQVTDAAGRMVLQKEFHAITTAFTEKLLADSKWSAGLYYISITDNKNKLVSKSSFIFQ